MSDVHLYISLMLISLIFFILRIVNTNFVSFSKSASSFINSNFGFIVLGFSLVVILFLLGRNQFVGISKYMNSRKFRIIVIALFCAFVLASFLFDYRYSGYFIRSIRRIPKYIKFVNTFSFNWVMWTGILLSIIYAAIFVLRKKIKDIYVDRTAVLFFFGTTMTVLFAKMPSFNIIAGKFVSATYSRRFLYLHDVFYSFIIILFIVLTAEFINNTGRVTIKKQRKSFKVLYVMLILTLSITLVFPIRQRLNDESYNRSYILQKDNVFQYIRDNVEPWSVIASYQYPAMDVVAQTPNYFISSNTVHSPSVLDEKSRKNDTGLIFKFYDGLDSTLSLLKTYNASYILVENKKVYNSGYYPKIFIEKAAEYHDYFQIVYRDHAYYLYEIKYLN